LNIAADAVDLARWRAAVGRFRTRRANGNAHGALDAIHDGLQLFPGRALADVPGPWADSERVSLANERLLAIEQKLDLELELGRYEESVGQISRLIVEHPLQERLRVQLMLALAWVAGRRR
jgi:DNA-binding SARP family transcriptional activator